MLLVSLLRFAATRVLRARKISADQTTTTRLVESLLAARLRALRYVVIGLALLPTRVVRAVMIHPKMAPLNGLCAAAAAAALDPVPQVRP